MIVCTALLLLSFVVPASAQQRVYFVDGYHGGIYGHYPIEWKTRFLCDQLAEHPEWRIGLEIEPETWDTVQLRTPADYARFKTIATDPRVEFTNPTYAQPYCFNVSGESIIRQFEYGIRKIHDHFPQVEFTTYSVEEPCFTSSLPQILKLFGFKYASLKCPNTCWGGYTAPYGGELVNWTGPDGSAILTSPRHACEALQKNSVWQTTAWGNETEYLDACREAGIEHPVGMCYQDAGWKYGPWIGAGDSIRNKSIYVTWKEYFEQVTDGKTSDNYRLPQEDIRTSLVWGSQVLQRIAQQVRQSENKLILAEKMGAIANLSNGYIYKQEVMDEAWRTLMLAQHHDSWIVPYNGLHDQGTWADHIRRWTAATDRLCDDVIADAGKSFAEGKRSGESIYLRVYNTLGEARREVISAALPEGFGAGAVVTDANGRKIENYLIDNSSKLTFEASVPAFGYATYLVKPGKAAKTGKKKAAQAQAGVVVIENGMYRMVIDPAKGGVIRSLIAKAAGAKEYADPKSPYAIGELRGHFYEEGKFHSSTEHPATVTLVRDNRLEKCVRICGTIASAPFTQTITLREGDARIDFDLTIDWKHNVGIGAYSQKDAFNSNARAFYDDRYNLNILFPVALESPTLDKDAPFDVCRSQLTNTHFSTWDGIKHNIILNWVDLAEANGGNALALLTDHTTSYSYGEDAPLGLTVQFAGNGLWGRDYAIDGATHLRFALIPHRKAWDSAAIQQQSMRWNEPLICTLLPAAATENASLIDLAGSGYELSAVYPCKGGIVVRLYNAAGDASPRIVRLGTAMSGVEEIDLNGNTLARYDLRTSGKEAQFDVQMPRFGLKTFRLTK